jgi:hypothetical protein
VGESYHIISNSPADDDPRTDLLVDRGDAIPLLNVSRLTAISSLLFFNLCISEEIQNQMLSVEEKDILCSLFDDGEADPSLWDLYWTPLAFESNPLHLQGCSLTPNPAVDSFNYIIIWRAFLQNKAAVDTNHVCEVEDMAFAPCDSLRTPPTPPKFKFPPINIYE